MNNKQTKTYWLFLLPSFVGVLLFFVIPFVFSLYYALIDNMGSQSFVGLKNFTDTLTNDLFQSASLNTVIFIALAVPIGMAIALFLAICLRKMKAGRGVATLFLLLPLVVPSGTIVYFWQVIFGNNGLLTETLLKLGFEHASVSQNQWTMGILVVVFLWKNVSYNIVLFWSGLNWIPKSYYENMSIEGAGAWRQFASVTWVYLSPTTFVVLLMSIVNSFKVFKEIYMLYGTYPSQDIYMLQHYMNNQFMSLNMQKLSSAAYIMFLVLAVVLLIIFRVQKKLTEQFY